MHDSPPQLPLRKQEGLLSEPQDAPASEACDDRIHREDIISGMYMGGLGAFLSVPGLCMWDVPTTGAFLTALQLGGVWERIKVSLGSPVATLWPHCGYTLETLDWTVAAGDGVQGGRRPRDRHRDPARAALGAAPADAPGGTKRGSYKLLQCTHHQTHYNLTMGTGVAECVARQPPARGLAPGGHDGLRAGPAARQLPPLAARHYKSKFPTANRGAPRGRGY